MSLPQPCTKEQAHIWLNTQLKPLGLVAKDMEKDLSDGFLFLSLLKKAGVRPAYRFHPRVNNETPLEDDDEVRENVIRLHKILYPAKILRTTLPSEVAPKIDWVSATEALSHKLFPPAHQISIDGLPKPKPVSVSNLPSTSEGGPKYKIPVPGEAEKLFGKTTIPVVSKALSSASEDTSDVIKIFQTKIDADLREGDKKILEYKRILMSMTAPASEHYLELAQRHNYMADMLFDLISLLRKSYFERYTQGQDESLISSREKECLYHMDQSLKYYEKAYPENHPTIISVYKMIRSVCYNSKGEYPSLSYDLKLLGILERHCEPHDRELMNQYMVVAAASAEYEKYDDAERYYKKVIEIQKRVMGDNTQECAKIYGKIAKLYMKKFKYDVAWSYLEKSFSILRSCLGENHIDVIDTYTDMAVVKYRLMNDLVEGEKMLRVALTCYLSRCDKSSERVTRVLTELEHIKEEKASGERIPATVIID